jgi:prepilin-type N-terminal cleavage/methylation domain-containing protein
VSASRGFTLVELLVALVLLEVGLLGVAGTVVLASRTLSRAEERERAVTRAALVLDSLEGTAGGGSGAWIGAWGQLHWSRDADGRVELRVVPRHGRPWVVQDAALPGGRP